MNKSDTLIDPVKLLALYRKTYNLKKLTNSVDQSSIHRAIKRGSIKYKTLKRYCDEFHFDIEDLIISDGGGSW